MHNLNLNDIEVLVIDDLENINRLNEVPKPPVSSKIVEPKNLKKENGKINIKIILILVLIILMGVGLYFFLSYAKKNVDNQIKLEEITIELGQKLEESNIDYKDCKVDLSKVNSEKVGKYEYSVECENRKYTSYIHVKDSTAPIVSLKLVNIEKGQSFSAEDFVLGSYDLSKIAFKLANEENIENNNQENGIYLIPISTIDEYENMTSDYGILYVSNVLADKYLSASKISSTTYDATLNITDKIGFNSVNYYIHAIRIYEYTFNSKEEYENIKKNALNSNSVENIAGKVIAEDAKLKITLVKELSREDLNVLNGSFPATYNDISALYSNLGYTNKIESN